MIKTQIFIILTISQILSQDLINQTFIKKILDRESIVLSLPKTKTKKPFRIVYNQKLFINSNLPNLENLGGLYIPKGFGLNTSFLLEFRNDFLYFSAEPQVQNIFRFPSSIPQKENIFSVLNDVELKNPNLTNNRIKNIGFKLHYKNLNVGYGNWNHWWGPGVHNSLGLSNNANGFYHLYADLQNYELLDNTLYVNAKLLTSSEMSNYSKVPYYLSSWLIDINYQNINAGFSSHILSGGVEGLPWSFHEALLLPFSKKNIKYWDNTNLYYLSYSNKSSNLKIYYEWGYPKRSFGNYSPSIFSDHSRGSVLGMIKYSIFDNEDFFGGFEVTRLLQGSYYYKIPSPNWYDNIKYNYSSYNNRRWAAHSGSDSDDILIFIGFSKKRLSIIYGINFERHGITHSFPPEVKLENKFNVSYAIGNTSIYLTYENEYFEHYAFIDNNKNIWSQEFEPGSIQRTNTLLFSIEQTLFD